ncbi:ABC transporter permease [Rhodococcus sp. DT1]
MNTTFVGLELRRTFRDYVNVFFIAVLPAFFYLIFGASQSFATESAGNGNVAMYIMISMAAYGAVTATTGVGGTAAVERMQGWGRQLGLTPLTDASYVAMKATVALVVAAIPIGLIFVLGVFTGASGDSSAWILSAVAVLVGAAVFSVYGLVFGLAFRSEAAVGAAGGSLVILAFLGNIFIPLSGTLLTIAKFTPLYGYVSLARYPVTEGVLIDRSGNPLPSEPLWVPILNLSVWAVVFVALATWLVQRGRGRQ